MKSSGRPGPKTRLLRLAEVLLLLPATALLSSASAFARAAAAPGLYNPARWL